MMILPSAKDAVHKAWLYRVLAAIADDAHLARVLYFTGGTCAAMLDWLDRFSVDLDFDYAGTEQEIHQTKKALETLFEDLQLEIKDASKRGIQYFLRYPTRGLERNTLKMDTAFPVPICNSYAPQRLQEIDRVLTCQTRETMFANKLVAVMGRYEKTGHIAGRDIHDIHHFFVGGNVYNKEVIIERTKTIPSIFFQNLISFIEQKVTDKIITDDLNTLVTSKELATARKFLKNETLMLLRDELGRLSP